MAVFFGSQVVKNVASQSLEVKKLVYLYLLHYAEKYVTKVVFELPLLFQLIDRFKLY